MNREETKAAIEVMQAWLDGKSIEERAEGGTGKSRQWTAYALTAQSVLWDFDHYEYRIKQEPREFWITVVSGNGLKVEQISGAPFRSEPIGKIETGAFIKVREVLE